MRIRALALVVTVTLMGACVFPELHEDIECRMKGGEPVLRKGGSIDYCSFDPNEPRVPQADIMHVDLAQ